VTSPSRARLPPGPQNPRARRRPARDPALGSVVEDCSDEPVGRDNIEQVADQASNEVEGFEPPMNPQVQLASREVTPGNFNRSLRLLDFYWQEWRDSNPQPPVLETGALAIELHSYGAVSCPLPQSGARAHPAFTAATAGNLRGRAWPANRPS
jgi:hypothetical protein